MDQPQRNVPIPTGQTPRVPVLPITGGGANIIPIVPPTTNRVPVPIAANYITPTGLQNVPRIPVVPTTPTNVGLIPTVPVAPVATTNTRIPVVPVAPGNQHTVPILPPTGQRVPVPITPTQTDIPILPPGGIPPVHIAPTTNVRIPVVPVTPTTAAQPIVPIMPPIGQRVPVAIPPVPVQRPLSPGVRLPEVRLPTVGPPGVRLPEVRLPEVRLPPIIPPGPPRPVLPPDQAIRARLAQATFEVYTPAWQPNPFHIERNDTRPTIFSTAVQQHILQVEIGYYRKWLMEELMTNRNVPFVLGVLEGLGFTSFAKNPGTPDMYYNLLWYLDLAGPDGLEIANIRPQLDYASGLNVDQLINLLGPRYTGPTDRASLLFAIATGKSTAKPAISDLPRYPQIAALPPWLVWIIAMNAYNVIDSENEFASVYPPYVHWALQPQSTLDPILFAVTEQNVDNLMTTYQIPSPTRANLRTPRDKIKYFIKEILNYEPILTRAANTLPPPLLTGRTRNQITNMLSVYTLKEIVDAYEPEGTWSNRDELIETIALEARGGSRWSWRHSYCNNDDTLNILEVEPHGKVDKGDPTDPTLSYGVQKNYRCYQLSELAATFTDYDGAFIFRVPDWTAPGPNRPTQIDPTTGAPLISEFPLESIRQLQQLLQNPPPGYNVNTLTAKIQEGLAVNTEANMRVRALKAQYDKFTPEQQYLAKLYLVWLFVYGMWMRFWKGPGFPWPTFRVDVLDARAREREQRCSPEDRDEHSFIQQAIRTAFVETYEKDRTLRTWIESLPAVRYNFRNGDAHINTEPISHLLDRLMLGGECQGFAGDDVAQTGYYLITRMFNLNKVGMFDALIAEMLPPILNIEQQVVNNQLAAIKNPNANADVIRRVRVLRERQAALAQPIPKLPIFEPARVEHNIHINN